MKVYEFGEKTVPLLHKIVSSGSWYNSALLLRSENGGGMPAPLSEAFCESGDPQF